MNYIGQTWNTKLSNNPESPICNKLLSSENVETPTQPRCDSWRSRMVAKVKEYRDAIKNIVAFNKMPNTIETGRITGKGSRNFSINSRATTSVSSIPDIITFSSIALKHKEYEDELIPIRNSTLNSDEEEKLNMSMEQTDRANTTNDSLNRFASTDNTISSSLKSFLALEKQITEEFPDNDVFTIKKKISAEPFLSYAEGIAEFVWTDDTTEESSSGKAWNSLEYLNSSDIGFGNPRNNSTFSENSCVNKNRTSSPIKNCAFLDSGFENNFSI